MNASVAIQVLPKVMEQEDTRRIVDEVIAYLASTGLHYVVGPFETTLEGDLDQLLEAAVPETAEQLTAFFRAIEEEAPVPHWFDRDFKGNPPRPTQHISWPSGRTRHLTVT